MSSLLLSVVFLLGAADQPPTEATTQQPATQAATTPEPKMICKYENLTGSRVQKQKVCRPEGQTGNDQDSNLKRKMDRMGDHRVGGGDINVVGGGAGIGN